MLLKKINRLYYIKDGIEVNINSEEEDTELYYFPKEVADDKNIRVFKELQNGSHEEIIRNKSIFSGNNVVKVLTIAICFLYSVS